MKNVEKRENGITLVALVVTIVVLLILAGITITYVFGDNGVFGQASDAKVKTEIAKIEERAQMIYNSLLATRYQGGSNKTITTEDIVKELEAEGYLVEKVNIAGNSIEGITVEPKQIILAKNGVGEVEVKYQEKEDNFVYYVVVDGSYYEIKLINSGITVKQVEKTSEGIIVKNNLEIEGNYNTEIVKNIEKDENRITIIAGEGSTTITIKCGEYKDTLEVKIAPQATKIKAKAINMLEESSGQIEVILEPSDAVATLSYTTTDTSKITVNEEGLVISKKLNTTTLRDTAIVTVTDEQTGKTTTCNVTIEALKGTYIEYDVSYIDMVKGYNFTKENGWRMLSYVKNDDGTYSNIELISTGYPVEFFYYYNQKNNEWFVTSTNTNVMPNLTTFKREVLQYTNYAGTDTNYALQAAAGLYYNFGKIKFRYDTARNNSIYNQGWYKSITNEITYDSSTGKVARQAGNELFVKQGVSSGIRVLTLPEVNKGLGRGATSVTQFKSDKTGIFYPGNLENVPILGRLNLAFGNARCLLASPYPNPEWAPRCLATLGEGGSVSHVSHELVGSYIRPVVKLVDKNYEIEAVNNGSYRLIPKE
ncbi:MAG: type II secretion system protein [Clostridia bacterium]|nr:type II secretion system protein [Clostridia bacterium]MCI9413067.1 type II secretion system protein [Clostridia bacterium]